MQPEVICKTHQWNEQLFQQPGKRAEPCITLQSLKIQFAANLQVFVPENKTVQERRGSQHIIVAKEGEVQRHFSHKQIFPESILEKWRTTQHSVITPNSHAAILQKSCVKTETVYGIGLPRCQLWHISPSQALLTNKLVTKAAGAGRSILSLSFSLVFTSG